MFVPFPSKFSLINPVVFRFVTQARCHEHRHRWREIVRESMHGLVHIITKLHQDGSCRCHILSLLFRLLAAVMLRTATFWNTSFGPHLISITHSLTYLEYAIVPNRYPPCSIFVDGSHTIVSDHISIFDTKQTMYYLH